MSHTVIFTGGKSPAAADFVRYCNIHGTPDFAVAADSGLETALDFGIEPDEIVGDMDSLRDTSCLQNRAGKIQIFPRDKDFSDTELALIRAISHNKNAWITLVGGGGGRIDHFLSIFDIFSRPISDFCSETYPDFRPMDAWLPGISDESDAQALYFLPSEKTLEIKNIHHGENISVCRTTRSFSGSSVETQGLEWEGNLFRKSGMPSLSNRLSSKCDAASITARGADFVVIVPLKASCRRI